MQKFLFISLIILVLIGVFGVEVKLALAQCGGVAECSGALVENCGPISCNSRQKAFYNCNPWPVGSSCSCRCVPDCIDRYCQADGHSFGECLTLTGDYTDDQWRCIDCGTSCCYTAPGGSQWKLTNLEKTGSWPCDGSSCWGNSIVSCPNGCVSGNCIGAPGLAPEPPPVVVAPGIPGDNLYSLTQRSSSNSVGCVDSCPNVPCSSSQNCICHTSCDDEGNCETHCSCYCNPCSGPHPCPMSNINSVHSSLKSHYNNIVADYNIVKNSLDQIKNIDSPSIEESYKKINSLKNINGWTVKQRIPQIMEKLMESRAKMDLCFSELYQWEAEYEKKTILVKKLVSCEVAKDEYLAEDCYMFDADNPDKAENLFCCEWSETPTEPPGMPPKPPSTFSADKPSYRQRDTITISYYEIPAGSTLTLVSPSGSQQQSWDISNNTGAVSYTISSTDPSGQWQIEMDIGGGAFTLSPEQVEVVSGYCGDGIKNGPEVCDSASSATPCTGTFTQGLPSYCSGILLQGVITCKSDCTGWNDCAIGNQPCSLIIMESAFGLICILQDTVVVI